MDKNLKPKVTVLMPVYNAEKYLREAIDSILNQTFKDFEFLIINDSSTDNSKNIILSYKDQRIRYYENNKNLGVAKTLNKGLRLAKADYIARMDADDISLPDRLKVEYETIKKDKTLIMVASYFDWVDEQGNFFSAHKHPTLPEEIYYALQFRNCLGHPTVFFNKKIILNEFNGYNDKCEAEDNDLWLRLSKKYKIVKVDKVLAKVRRSKHSRTGVSDAIDRSAIIITQDNLQSLIGKSISLDVVKILADYYPLRSSPPKIKQALVFLKEINLKLLDNCPLFLDKSVIKKYGDKKINRLKFDLIVTTLFYSRFGSVFRALFKIYLSIKYPVLKIIRRLDLN